MRLYSNKLVMSKAKLANPETFATIVTSNGLVIMPYNKVNNNFAFELRDALEATTNGAQLLGWRGRWFNQAERLNLILVFGTEETLRVRPLQVMSIMRTVLRSSFSRSERT